MTPETVYKEYSKGVEFNSTIKLYDCVKTNENFFIGKQWEDVQSNGLPKPVFNILKRVVLFSVASISTDNLKLHASVIPSINQRGRLMEEAITDVINRNFEKIFERNNISSLLRCFCRNAAVDGDGATYSYWDEDIETGQMTRGGIVTESLSNTQVIFGNPNSHDLQGQPYIIIARRMMVEQAKERAKKYGGNIEDIVSDEKEENGQLDALGGDKVTVLLKLRKEGGTVKAFECTQKAIMRKEWDLGISIYPITWMSWDAVQDCYHGQAMITGLIPNQIFINKLFAMSMISLMTTAYPTVIYDGTRIKKWNNRVGSAIKMNGGDVSAVAKIMDPAAISPQISQFIELAVSLTQKTLGASDVALGDTRPDNTSAIIALQRASSVPMEITKQNLLQSVEDLGRIYIEFMKNFYGNRFVDVENPQTGEKDVVLFDFAELKDYPMSIKLDVGGSSYWSEIATMQTMDNLLMQGKIDTVEYLKRIPAGMITDKESLIDALRRGQQQIPLDQNGQPEGGVLPQQGKEVAGGSGYHELQRKINQTGDVPKEG